MPAVLRILAMGSALWATCLSAQANGVPEPSGIWLAGGALAALVYIITRNKK
jgi:hypothetical protein